MEKRLHQHCGNEVELFLSAFRIKQQRLGAGVFCKITENLYLMTGRCRRIVPDPPAF